MDEALKENVPGAQAGSQEIHRESPLNRTREPLHEQNVANSTITTPIDANRLNNRLLQRLNGKMGSAETAPSDTQVVSQSVFDHIIQQNNDENNTLKTLHEGDSGHIDLLAGFDNTQLDANNTEDNEDQGDADPSSPLDYQPNFFPESQRFITKTPATVVKQRHIEDRSQNASPLVSFNPLASAKSNSGTMALSQMFESTQVPSSPIVNRLQSDQPSERPSPNLPIQRHSLTTALSSPTTKLAATFPQDTSEMNMNYISIKESQAEREKRIQAERMTRSAEHIYAEEHSDDEFSKESSFVERMKRRKMIDELSSAQFAALTAPARPASSRSSRSSKRSDRSPREQETRGQADGQDERQEPIAPSQNGSISEEETEQEDDEMYLPMPRSQEPNLLTEEDKENHNGVPASPLAATASAHDRLSQALALKASPPPSNKMAIGERTTDLHTPNPDEQVDGVGRSSQIYIVRDSQQSPTRGSQTDKTREQNNLQTTFSQQQVARSDLDKQSPPPPTVSQRNSSPSFPNHDHAATRTRSASRSSVESSSHLPGMPSAIDPVRTQSSNPASQPALVRGDKLVSQEKSSSMPSRVVETPVHQQSGSFGDVAPGTTIPETSPNRLHNQGLNSDVNEDAAAQEDDDLPLVYPSDHDRTSQSRPLGLPSSSTVKNAFNSKILSSPSGRQRRALTEIASEASPGGPVNFDIDFDILTADDREFRSVVAMSPNPPRKKRRGNDGQNIYASDPVLPVTPRPSTPRYRPVQEQELITEEPQLEVPQEEPETTFRRRSKPSNRAETVWDVDDASPQYHVSRTGRRSFFRSRPQRPPQTQESENETTDLPASVDHQNDTSERPAKMDDQMDTTFGENTDRPAEAPKDITVQEERTPARPSSPGCVQIAHNQILAPWSGPKRAYYPATCFGTPFGTSASRYLVKFEDSLPIEVPITTVKRLELRIGDTVKVEIPKFPKIPHVIRGFDDKLSQEDLDSAINNGIIPMTDVYGNLSVILEPKARKSFSNETLPQAGSVIKVPISRIYLDTILWNQLKDRAFSHDANAKVLEDRPQTPAGVPVTPTPPSSRLSRTMRYMSGLFAGMVFAVSYVDDDVGKSRTTRLILENGGRIIDGFNELFDFPSNVPLATPTNAKPATNPTENKSNLRLTRSAEDLGFACVIADKHSRREKYMQALALNLPCLSGRWVEDCIAQNRILDWEMYLLPAGDSTYLNGAAKSRVLTPTLAINARFSHTIAGRPKLLDGQSVLIVMGRGKEEEKSRAYIFLTYALGASRVERVYDLKSAKVFLDQEAEAGLDSSWNWVYVHCYDQDTVRAEFRQSTDTESNSGRGTKRRKLSHFMGCINGQELSLSSKITVVGNDFVCQSLILGRLFEA